MCQTMTSLHHQSHIRCSTKVAINKLKSPALPRRFLRTLATSQPQQETSSSSSTPKNTDIKPMGTNMVQELQKSADTVFHRYDFVSAGMGALAVTSFCVARGQDPFLALSVTAASTVVALLLNDALHES